MGGELTWQAVSNAATVIGILVVIFAMAHWAAKILAAISRLSEQVGALDGRMGALEGQMGEMKGEVGELRGQIGGIEGQAAANRKTLSELRAEIVKNGKAIAVIQGFLMPWLMVRGASDDASNQIFKKVFGDNWPSEPDEENAPEKS